jgi:hypothetical protein
MLPLLDRHVNAEDPIQLSDSDDSDCSYEGGVHGCLPSDIEEDLWTETDDQSSSDLEEEMSDFDEEINDQGNTGGVGPSFKAYDIPDYQDGSKH